MKKRVFSFLLAVAMLCTMLPQITLPAQAVTITQASKVSGGDYTKSPELAKKLDEIFSGKASVYSNKGCTSLVNTALGTYSVPNNGVYQYVGPYGGSALNTGTSCWIYANGVYYTLFGEALGNGSPGSNSTKLSLSGGNGSTLTYANMCAWGVHSGVGAQIRVGGHSLVVLKYDSNGMVYIDGNGDGKGLVAVRNVTWAEVKASSNTNGTVKYIVQPKKSYLETKYPENNHIEEAYPCYGDIEITSNTSWVKSMPCSEKTDAESTNVEGVAAVKGAHYTAIGLVLNDVGNLWYKVEAKNGKTGYIYAGDTEFYSETDVDLSGDTPPVELKLGSSFPVTGVVSTQYSCLRAVHVYVQSKVDGTFPTYAQKRIELNDAISYDLSSPDMDYNIKFNQLPVGEYTYYVAASTRSCYAINAKEWGYTSDTNIILHESSFAVVKNTGTTSTSTLTFNANGGSCDTSTKKVVTNQKIGTLPTADVDDMCFEGWFTERFGGKEVTEDTYASGNMTLYAHYSYVDVKLNFDLDGGYLPGVVLEDTVDRVNDGRPGESLVIFNKSGTKPGTNIYGVEIAVNAQGKITAVRKYGDETQLTVPSGGFILSGQMGWDADAGVNVGGGLFVGQIADMEEAYVSFNYETGEVKAFESYAAYLVETKRGREWTTLGVLPVPTRDGYMFEGWRNESGSLVDYYSGFSGINLTASWTDEDTQYPDATLEYGGHYYELFDSNVTWTEAKRICEERGGYLVVITSAAEQSAIVELLAEGTRGMYRIGATDAETEGKWKWVNGETFSYSNWDPSYPEPSATKGENYSNIIAIENAPNKQVGEWVDDMDTFYGGFYDISNTGFVCEYDKKICYHSYTATRVEPTCTTAGYMLYTCQCGDSYRTEIPALGHSMAYVSAVEPTCTIAGLTEGTACSRCGTVGIAQDTVEALGHDYSIIISTTEPTCSEQGSTVKQCSRCSDTETTYIDTIEHNLVEILAVAPTCTKTGLTAGTKCDRCNTVIDAQEEVAATGHSFSGSYCKNCGRSIFYYSVSSGRVTITGYASTISGSLTIPSTIDGYPVVAIGSNAFRNRTTMTRVTIPNSVTNIGYGAFSGCTALRYVNYSGTQNQWMTVYIAGGNEKLKAAAITYHTHNYVTISKREPTCTTQGETINWCSGCDSMQTTNTDALGHNMVEVPAVAPTCTETGLSAGTKCDRCGEIGTAQTTVAALGHSFTNYVSDGNATCTADGTKTAECDRCDATDTVTDAGSKLGHDYSVTVSTTEATCTQQGSIVKKCSRCSSTDTTYIPIAGHDYAEDPTTCGACGHVRVSSEITSVVFRPSAAGIYFKGEFAVDAQTQVTRQGVVVSTSNALPVADDSDETSLYTTSGTSVLISGVLKDTNKDGQNAQNAMAPIYARTYVLLADGTYIYGDVVEVNLRQIVEGVDAKWNSLGSAQKSAILAMYEAYAGVMQFWEIPNMKEDLV